MKSWHFKFLAVLLAVIMWYFVVGEERAEVGLTVPLVLTNMPRNLIVVNNVPHGIEIRVNGPRSLVRSLSTENLSKTLDLANTREGAVSFSISSEGIPLPRGVKITRINPTQVTVILQNLLTKKITVHPRVTGKPALGYELESMIAIPEQVDIAGPDDVVEKLEGLYTKPIDIQGLKTDLKQRAFLDFRNYQVYLVKEIPLDVEVKIKKNNKK
jgi:YbbR domain-containing protein